MTNGTVDLFVSSAGVAAAGSVTASFSLPAGMNVTGSFTVELELNTGVTSHTFPGPSNTSVTVPAGPFLEVQVNNATISLGGGLSITGNFVFQQNTEPSFSSSGTSVGSRPAPERSLRLRSRTSTATACRTSSSASAAAPASCSSTRSPRPGPTCWRPGPTPVADWRPGHCGRARRRQQRRPARPDRRHRRLERPDRGVPQPGLELRLVDGFATTATQAWNTPYATSLAVGKLFGEGFNDLVVGVNTTGHSSSSSTTEVYENQGTTAPRAPGTSSTRPLSSRRGSPRPPRSRSAT